MIKYEVQIMNNKYFYVFNREEAEKIKQLTGQYYYVFDDKEKKGKIYSFVRNNSIIIAYRTIKEYEKKLNEYRI